VTGASERSSLDHHGSRDHWRCFSNQAKTFFQPVHRGVHAILRAVDGEERVPGVFVRVELLARSSQTSQALPPSWRRPSVLALDATTLPAAALTAGAITVA